MRRVFIGNFDFEHELDQRGWQPGDRIGQITAARASAWLAIAEPHDFILSPDFAAATEFDELPCLHPTLPSFVSDLEQAPGGPEIELVPWGWTERLMAAAERRGWRITAPPLDVVKHVNDRRFRWALEQEFDVALPGSQIVTTLDEAARAIRHSPAGWLFKASFGMSGRERLSGHGPVLGVAEVNWLVRRFDRHGGVVFEPRVEPLAEAGIQFTLPQNGAPQLIGITDLLTDSRGAYRGSRFASADVSEDWSDAVPVAQRAAQRLQDLGYFGPLGIDAMRYRDLSGATRLRPLQDLNARFTMGRLALGFRRLLYAGESATWLHFSWPSSLSLATWLREITPMLKTETSPAAVAACGIRIVATSPAAGRSLEPRSALLIAPTTTSRDIAETSLLAAIHAQLATTAQ